MSLFLFFGSVSLVILVGLGVVIHGFHHHFREAQKSKNSPNPAELKGS